MEEKPKDTTAPKVPTHKMTKPPGQGELDKDALEKGRERLAQLLGR